MKVAYLCYWDLASEDGVARKIEHQAALWREAGHEVEVVTTWPPRIDREAVAAVEGFGPDLLYVRYDLFGPAVWRLARRLPTVVEVNTDDRREFRLRRLRARAYNRVNRVLVLGAARGVVCVTRELARPFGGRAAVIANGADPRTVPFLPVPGNPRPRAVFSGTPLLAWHGVDRLLELAEALPEVDFDLVGPTPAARPDNVAVHRTLRGDAYWEVLARADVAFGSLAMDRAGLREGCPLKVREYLLAGLPTVIGYEDTDFPGEQPWYLARYESPEQVRAFVERVRGRRAPRDDLVPRLSWQAKEQARLAFFDRVLADRVRVSDTIAEE